MNPPKVPTKLLEKYFRAIRLARASELASRGKLRAAFAIISPDNKFPSHEDELDLLGKIAAQLKEYTVAKQCWELALNESPNNQEYSDCLKLVNEVMQRPPRVIPIKGIIIGGLIACSVMSLISKGCGKSKDDSSETAPEIQE